MFTWDVWLKKLLYLWSFLLLLFSFSVFCNISFPLMLLFYHVVFELFYLIRVFKNFFYSMNHSWATFCSSGSISLNSAFFIFCMPCSFLSLFLFLFHLLCYFTHLSCWYCGRIPSWCLSNFVHSRSGYTCKQGQPEV